MVKGMVMWQNRPSRIRVQLLSSIIENIMLGTFRERKWFLLLTVLTDFEYFEMVTSQLNFSRTLVGARWWKILLGQKLHKNSQVCIKVTGQNWTERFSEFCFVPPKNAFRQNFFLKVIFRENKTKFWKSLRSNLSTLWDAEIIFSLNMPTIMFLMLELKSCTRMREGLFCLMTIPLEMFTESVIKHTKLPGNESGIQERSDRTNRRPSHCHHNFR